MFKILDTYEGVLLGAVGAIIAGLLALLADGIFCREIPFEGKIIDKFYKAESNQAGTGVGVSSSGKPGVIITSSHESEKFLVMVQTKEGAIFTSEALLSKKDRRHWQRAYNYRLHLWAKLGLQINKLK